MSTTARAHLLVALALAGASACHTPVVTGARVHPAPVSVPAPAPRAEPPAGFVEMTVMGVVETGNGDAVLLVDAGKEIGLPIFISGTEGMSIALRHAGRRFQRPLTHDLLDAVMREMGGQLVKVQIDSIQDTTFVGSVHVRHGGRVATIDARPSDAIALAIGSRAPIFVERKVLDAAGFRPGAQHKPRPAPSGPGPI